MSNATIATTATTVPEQPSQRPLALAQKLADAIEEEIVLGWLQPRERLVEEDLAARFGAKRHVVREAIFALERIGLVERTPNKGAVVRLLPIADAEHIHSVREVLEPLAAQQIPLPGDAALVARLTDIQAQHSAAVEAADPRAAFRANMAFHDTLFAGCGNPYLAETIRALAQKAHGMRSYTAADPVYLARARDEHVAIIAALRDGDRARLVDLCRTHLAPAAAAYIAALRRRFPR